MVWQVLKADQLPLGCRVLRPGSVGNDVAELQKMLAQAGFYFGRVDGCYGVLTESAVAIAERTFGLRVDGIAGKRILKTLKGLFKKIGRTVYTVKQHENLGQISQKFGVTPKAWGAIAGQGNPLRTIFPGMKLILEEKAVLVWNEKAPAEGMTVTGRLVNGGVMNRRGGLEITKEADPNSFLVIGADPDVWEEVLTSTAGRNRFLADLRRLRFRKIGLDFRPIKPELSRYWKKLLKAAGRQRSFAGLFFVIAPFFLSAADSWRNNRLLQWIACCEGIDWLMVEAQPGLETGSDFEEQMAIYYKYLAELNRKVMQKIIPVIGNDPWQMAEEAKVSYKEARMLRALNYRTARYLPEIKLTAVDYSQKDGRQRLYYRDYQGWADLLAYLKRYHFPGMVIYNPGIPGITLPELIADAFKVLPERKFLEMGRTE